MATTTRETGSRQEFGLVVEGPDAAEVKYWPRARFIESLSRHSYLVIRGLQLSDEEFLAMAETAGTPIRYAFGKVLNMEAREKSLESQFTNAPVPLHQDAILNRNNRAAMLFFKCKETPGSGGGETLITDNRQFMRVAPAELLTELRGLRVAYRSLSPSYYEGGGGADQAIERPAIARHPKTGEEVLYIALDAPADPRRNCQASIVGYTERESARVMTEIDCVLRRRDVLYLHSWVADDVVVLDNYLVCHGRNAFGQGEQRRLLRVVTE
jgi:alpha-ketoglutarate-dependent taurine dioxygenase